MGVGGLERGIRRGRRRTLSGRSAAMAAPPEYNSRAKGLEESSGARTSRSSRGSFGAGERGRCKSRSGAAICRCTVRCRACTSGTRTRRSICRSRLPARRRARTAARYRLVVRRRQLAGTGGAAMILVTGGAGFIGSNLVRALNRRGRSDIVVVDDLSRRSQVRESSRLRYRRLLGQSQFAERLARARSTRPMRSSIKVPAP